MWARSLELVALLQVETLRVAMINQNLLQIRCQANQVPGDIGIAEPGRGTVRILIISMPASHLNAV